jgi:EAL domain-containing protein (putative c-di-GMP-specific phosphodiesterase class I)
MVNSRSHTAIIQAIIALARTLSLRTVAEGIEDRAQFELLNKLGCDEYQGYYFSRPVPAQELVPLLQREAIASAA